MSGTYTEVKFRLVKDGNPLYLSSSSNDGADFCNDRSFELVDWETDEGFFQVDSYDEALFVKHNSTDWYNSSEERPVHNFKADELTIVRVEMTIKQEEMETEADYYGELAQFLRDEYSQEKYHNTPESVEKMVKHYCIDKDSVDRWTWEKFQNWKKERNAKFEEDYNALGES